MKIREIITEQFKHSHKRKSREKKVFHVGNEHAKIARTSKEAAKQHKEANPGVEDRLSDNDSMENLRKVRDMYGVQLVDDFIDVLELPNAVNDTDKQMSMFSKDMRK